MMMMKSPKIVATGVLEQFSKEPKIMRVYQLFGWIGKNDCVDHVVHEFEDRKLNNVSSERSPATFQYFSIQAIAYLQSIGCNCNVKFCSSIKSDPSEELWGIEMGANRNANPTFLFDFYTHHKLIVHHLATMQNTQTNNRQSDIKRRTMQSVCQPDNKL